MWEFMTTNPGWALLMLIVLGAIVRRIVTSACVWLRGWPPPHLDVRGDFKSEDDDG